ncbi:hypothetical protein G4G28_16380 [Massilia sp. Dwa41.01b]|uniref:hypothetical protein n=1 Tax=unclassified Massilia TaxID=2609279 RepID=UPI0015FEBF5F|nr:MULTISPECIES: hypothetical protein [unclassified Massilia]QNA89651.1 hypothetical protein G4G28_16380 [Massilia sp. Dwa41.01b]QNB00548.1 hypothetical protein G4G31_19955 [Massilia sp. Se16.2.3]
MFFFRHPRPVIDGRAVAVQVVQQKATRETSHAVLVVDTPAGAGKAGMPDTPSANDKRPAA